MFVGGIQFRDRPLLKGETSHWVCEDCGEELHPDSVPIHKCQKRVGEK